MNHVTNSRSNRFSLLESPTLTAIGAAIPAIALGAGIVTVGAGSTSRTLALAVASSLICGAVIWTILDLPVVMFARMAFIVSFFIKIEFTLFKIDEVEDPSGFNISLAVVCAAFLLIHDLLTAEKTEPRKRFPAIFAALTFCLLICALLSVIYSGAGNLGFFSLWSLTGSITITACLASHFTSRERVKELITGIAAGLMLTGLIALSQYVLDFPSNLAFFGTGTEEERLGTQADVLSRAQAFLRTPTEMGWVVSALIPLVIAPLVCRVRDFSVNQKFILALAGLAGAAAVILSLARGSWFGLIIGIAVLLGGGWRHLSATERRRYFLTAAAAVLVGLIFLAPFAGRIHERLTSDDEGSAAIRIPLLEVAGRLIEDNPLVGVGLNNYRASMTKYDETGIFVTQIFPNPVHNVFAHVAAETGIPGAIFFCLLIVAAFGINLRSMSGADDYLRFALALALVAGMLAWIISAMKEPSSLGSARPAMRTLFFLFGLTIAVSRLDAPKKPRGKISQ